MALTFHDTHCCAIQEIDGLKGYLDQPKKAMFDFCEKNIATKVKFKGFSANSGVTFSFYLFTAAVYTVKESGKPPYRPGAKYGDNYGSQFARFIREHKLGTLLPSPIKKNKAYHRDHFNQAWLWCPDREALVKWYADECAEFRAAEEARAAKLKVLKELVAQIKAKKPPVKVRGYWYPAATVKGYPSYVCPTCGKGFQDASEHDHIYYTYDYAEPNKAYYCMDHGLDVCGTRFPNGLGLNDDE